MNFSDCCDCLSPLSQTKDALFTILKDLRPGDHFNFISFSNKIKVWQPNRLVPVTPLNVRDAKKFIYMLVPTGGEMFPRALVLVAPFITSDNPPPQAQTSTAPSTRALRCFVNTSRALTPAPTACHSLFS